MLPWFFSILLRRNRRNIFKLRCCALSPFTGTLHNQVAMRRAGGSEIHFFSNSEHNAIHAKLNCKTAPFPGLGPANIYNVAEPADTRCMIQILLLGRLRSSLEYPYI